MASTGEELKLIRKMLTTKSVRIIYPDGDLAKRKVEAEIDDRFREPFRYDDVFLPM